MGRSLRVWVWPIAWMKMTVIRAGAGITTDPESYRFLRDQYPSEIAQAYVGSGAGTLSLDPNNNPITLTTGIPIAATPAITNGFTSLPVTIGTNTTPSDIRRGYIESWNLFLQHDFGRAYVANIGYVGNSRGSAVLRYHA